MPGKRDSMSREHVTACRGACDSMPGESCDDMVWICTTECGELRDSMTENVQHHVEGGGGHASACRRTRHAGDICDSMPRTMRKHDGDHLSMGKDVLVIPKGIFYSMPRTTCQHAVGNATAY